MSGFSLEPQFPLRLVVPLIAGIVMGVPNRTARVGIGGHVLVTLATCLCCYLALPVIVGAQHEVVRLAQGVICAIGLASAVTVLRLGNAGGLAAASSIWISGAVGCEAGLGNPWLALAISVVVAVLSVAIQWVERGFSTSAR